ncbi:MAG: adenine deaminase [Candidatus Marinimicrobia bacterium]|nr:adenine deaminase [Candidatus Neomarinimicrobiota bacterium]
MPNPDFEISGNIVDLFGRRTFPGTITVVNGRIVSIQEAETAIDHFILPGLIDAHIHIESSMLVPTEFSRLAVAHGTLAAVCDPHEIANVLGIAGVEFMLDNANQTPFKFYFGAPSCVPATPFETAGARIDLVDIKDLFNKHKLKFLSEMMNVPGALNNMPEVAAKLKLTRELGLPIDGHAPGLRGPDAEKYIAAGISTDHECFTLAEAREKISNGMKIQIREGSAARNFNELYPLIDEYPNQCMLCSDDKHPDDLVRGHINLLIRRGIAAGLDIFSLLRAASVVPVEHYKLDLGLLRVGDTADFIIVDGLTSFNVKAAYLAGRKVAEEDQSLLLSKPVEVINNFNCRPKSTADFAVEPAEGLLKTIDIIPSQLVTKSGLVEPSLSNGNVVADETRDILKMTVINRYRYTLPAIGFVRGMGIKAGALASSVAHDSHNIVAVGTTDELLGRAVNMIIDNQGGIAAVTEDDNLVLPLPVAGIMSAGDGLETARLYEQLDKKAKQMGSDLPAPFMSLSFLALLVIPELKLSDQGLFDGVNFEFTSIFG